MWSMTNFRLLHDDAGACIYNTDHFSKKNSVSDGYILRIYVFFKSIHFQVMWPRNTSGVV